MLCDGNGYCDTQWELAKMPASDRGFGRVRNCDGIRAPRTHTPRTTHRTPRTAHHSKPRTTPRTTHHAPRTTHHAPCLPGIRAKGITPDEIDCYAAG